MNTEIPFFIKAIAMAYLILKMLLKTISYTRGGSRRFEQR